MIAGLAGMVGGAISTGTGAYLRSKSQREFSTPESSGNGRRWITTKQKRVKSWRLACRLAHLLTENKEGFIKALARSRDNFSEDNLNNPSTSALTGFSATAIGAFIPIIPFFFTSGIPAIILAASVSLMAHFTVGAAKSLMTVRPWWKTGLELTAFGAVEGVVTYSVGIALGRIVGSQ